MLKSVSVVAVYSSFRTARGVVRELVEYGFEPERISIAAAARDSAFQFLEGPSGTGFIYARGLPAENGAGARLGCGIGAMAGVAAGLAASGFSTGLFQALLLWIGSGGLAGSLLGWMLAVMLSFGIPEKEAEQYAEDIREGNVLVTVQVDQESASLLREILCRFEPHEINDQPPDWAQPGWAGFR